MWSERKAYTVTLPRLPRKHGAAAAVSTLMGTTLMEVNVASPRGLRRAVYDLGKQFRREFGYDWVGYGFEGHEEDPDHRAYLWTAHDPTTDSAFAYGACCFRRCPEWTMKWIWLHPYERHNGHLQRAWSLFEERMPGFRLEPPLSSGMERFLLKRGIDPKR